MKLRKGQLVIFTKPMPFVESEQSFTVVFPYGQSSCLRRVDLKRGLT